MQCIYRRRHLLLSAASAPWLLSHSAWSQGGAAGAVRVAAASDLQLALPKIVAAFERETGLKVTVTYGASGNLARQLAQGLPAELFMSADEALVARLHASGWARDAGVVYAHGRLALMVQKVSPLAPSKPSQSRSIALDADLRGLQAFAQTAGNQAKFAIANPAHAPYGRAAQAALEKTGLWQALQAHLVLGENVSQATQFVRSGAAQAGLVALSIAAAPELASATRHIAVNPALHPPIIQRMALHRGANANAQRLYAYLQTMAVKHMLEVHNFK